MRTRGPAVVASAVVAAGTFYLARLNSQSPPEPHHHHHYPVAVQPSVGVTSEPSAPPAAESLRFYACAVDGHTMLPYQMRLAVAGDLRSLAYLAAVKAVAGPADRREVIRFPLGTIVRSVQVHHELAIVDLSTQVEHTESGGFAELGEFKALVWTMTELPGIQRVRIVIGGERLPTLPGGHLELDEPLARSDF